MSSRTLVATVRPATGADHAAIGASQIVDDVRDRAAGAALSTPPARPSALAATSRAPAPRIAVPADGPQIEALMRASVADIFPRWYDAPRTAGAVEHVARLDPLLVTDGTYLVHEAGAEIVACGGWSRRAKLHAGSGSRHDDDRLLDPATEPARVRAMFVRSDQTRRGLGGAILQTVERAAAAEGFRALTLMATLPGVPLYAAFGFVEVERLGVRLTDGVVLDCVVMDRTLEVASP